MPALPPRCLQADAREADGYDRVLQGRKANLLLTDPPYCLLTRRRKGGDLRDPKGQKLDRGPVLRFETVRDYRRFTEAWLPQAAGRLTPEAPLVLWTNFLGKEPLTATARALGYGHLAGEFVWAKRSSEHAGSEQLLRVYEVALVLLRAPLPQPGPGDPPRCWSAVAGYDDDGEAARTGGHPNHKPFGVLDALVRTWSRPGDLVLDPFAGSGSIGAAALRLSREAACLEIEPDWAVRASARLESAALSFAPR